MTEQRGDPNWSIKAKALPAHVYGGLEFLISQHDDMDDAVKAKKDAIDGLTLAENLANERRNLQIFLVHCGYKGWLYWVVNIAKMQEWHERILNGSYVVSRAFTSEMSNRIAYLRTR